MAGSCRVSMSGPLSGFGEGFVVELSALGYAPRSCQGQLLLMAHLSRWLTAEGLAVEDLTVAVAERFLAARRQVYSNFGSSRALVPLLGYLRGLGVVPPAPAVVAVSAAEILSGRFARYLATQRGLAVLTVASYVSQVQPFLAEYAGSDWSLLTGRQVAAFIEKRAVGQPPRSVQVRATALRALLGWMWRERIVSAPLANAVGSVAARSGPKPPKALSASQVDDLFTALGCDGPARLRNEAMLALSLRLGLRAGEVASLRLDDIDWRAGLIVVHGKGNRVDQVPLPVDVGQLLAAYLQRGRPVSSGRREVFLALDAPHAHLTSLAVSCVASRALAAAGISGPGAAHRLRHTAACKVLAGGGGLVEAGQLLRHSSGAATGIYAKSDLAALAVLARPWPLAATL